MEKEYYIRQKKNDLETRICCDSCGAFGILTQIEPGILGKLGMAWVRYSWYR